MEWQPIETAPRDGTWVLVHGGNAGDGDETFFGTPSDPQKAKEQEDAIRKINDRPVVARWYYDGWVYAGWDSDWRSWVENPTHWMPLPEPPQGA